MRAGRVFDVELDVADAAEAERVGREAADRVLANGLIEGFEVVVEGAEAADVATAAEATAEPEADSPAEGEEVAAE